MNLDIALILAIDGLASGAIYALIAIGTVLIFTVTRVVYVPFGDIAAFTALTLAALEVQKLPGTAGLVIVLACLATILELITLVRIGRPHEIPRALLFYLIVPLLLVGIVWLAKPLYSAHMVFRIIFALLLIVPIAPLLDRIVYRPIANGSVLLLLIVSMALHFALVGIGLLFFGPEGVRTQPMTDSIFVVGQVIVTGQTLLIMIAAILFSGLLYLFFEFSLVGKSLRATAVNRTGARLMGIRPERSGTIAYIVGSLMAGVSGILIAPVNTIFYRFRLSARPQGLRGRDYRRHGQLPGHCNRLSARGRAGKLCIVPGQRAEGCHRLLTSNSDSHLAIDRLRSQ